MTDAPNTQPAVDALRRLVDDTASGRAEPYSKPRKKSRVFGRTCTSLLAMAMQKLLSDSGCVADQVQSNGLFCVHQLRVTLPDDNTLYRVIVAPADAPIEINGVPADQHFLDPIDDEG